MNGVSKIERDDYLIVSNPDLNNEHKIINSNYIIGSGERALFFGELQVYNTLRIEGEINILNGNLYNYILNYNITYDQNIYGVITIDGIVNIDGVLNII
jgi:hypothetical protein